MVSARAYLQDDVFTRLTQAPEPQPRPPDSPARGPRGACSSSGASVCSISTMSRSRSDTSLSDGAMLRFLQRQNVCEEGRRERLNLIESATAPPLRPEICERSSRLAERRQAKLAQGCSQDGKKPSESAQQEECTFKPAITTLAAQRDARSVSEISLGDQRRREAKVARMRDEMQKKDVSSFAPKIKEYEGIGSRLKLIEEPDTLLERMAKEKKAQQTKRQKELERCQKKELAACTFAPEVKPAPDFVRRLASSSRAIREERDKENCEAEEPVPAPRPAWQ